MFGDVRGCTGQNKLQRWGSDKAVMPHHLMSSPGVQGAMG